MLTHKVKIRNKFVYPYICEDTFFTLDEIEKLVRYCDEKELEVSQTINNDQKIRKSKNAFIHLDNENANYFAKLLDIMNAANNEFFGFDLIGFDYFQYTVYDQKGAHYDYHTDYEFQDSSGEYSHLSRKLSCSLFLSDPSDYKGGDFEIMTSESTKFKIEQPKGRIVFFPSFMMHKVHPIKSGVRKSIVIWGLGPSWK